MILARGLKLVIEYDFLYSCFDKKFSFEKKMDFGSLIINDSGIYLKKGNSVKACSLFKNSPTKEEFVASIEKEVNAK